MATEERDTSDRLVEEDRTCSRLTLDIWRPDCWTLEVTDGAEVGLLGHSVYEVDGRAIGWHPAFADTRRAVDAPVAAARESPRTGLYAWPRGTTAADLAPDLDVSKTTVLEHSGRPRAGRSIPDTDGRAGPPVIHRPGSTPDRSRGRPLRSVTTRRPPAGLSRA